MNKRITLFMLLWLTIACFGASAQIELPALIGDNMVLQQNAQVKLWGKSSSLKKIKIAPSWTDDVFTAVPSAQGDWEVFIPTTQAGGPYEISFKQKEEITIHNILIGEVWICSGQSNMEMPLKGFSGQPIHESNQTIADANKQTPIRLFTVNRAYSKTETDSLNSHWETNSPLSASNFSATGYFFAMQLYKTLRIPIGIIHTSWSASKIEAWMKPTTLQTSFPQINLDHLKPESAAQIPSPNVKGGALYNAMIYPLRNYTIQGVIWYQGESNSSQPTQYKELSKSWVADWRETFKNPTLPFYITEIAPYKSSDKEKTNLPRFRDAQREIVEADPYMAMAYTADLGSEHFIHPPQKKEVGHRLAYCALAKTYNIPGIAYESPTVKAWKKDGDKYIIEMKGATLGLTPWHEAISGFEFLTKDQQLVQAKAKIITGSSKIAVWCDSLIHPIEIRYAYKNFGKGNLKNGALLPAPGFKINLKK